MQVSSCCHAAIVEGSRNEYPLGGRTWSQTFKIDVCEDCGKEVEETLTACEECGEIDCTSHMEVSNV